MTNLAIILGAGPGLGQALARRFARGGMDIALLARDTARLDVLSREIAGETGVTVRGYPADATDLVGFRAAIERVMADMGPARVFIHSVSRWIPAKTPDLDPATLMSEMALSVGAALLGSQLVLPGMEREGGTILWTGSRMALHPEANGAAPALGASKCALRALALSGAKAFHDRGVNFATITIDGAIKPGTAFDPDAIAEAFWDAHAAPRDDWRAERIFTGGD